MEHIRESSSRTHQRSLSSASAIQSPTDIGALNSFRSDQRLMEFYGLDELYPETWNEQPATNTMNTSLPNGTQDNQVVNIAPVPTAVGHDYYEEEDVDPLGLKPSILGKLNSSKGQDGSKLRKIRNQILLTSREFDSKKFLLETHKHTGYNDLLTGYKNLQNAVDKRQETLKSLVKTNFDRFVGAKATVEAVYRELKVKNLDSAGYGTESFYKELDGVSSQANSLYGPIIERRNKVDKIRATMNVLDRYKFYFNLPSSLEESIKKGRFEQAVRDYRKGKSVLTMTRNADNKAETGGLLKVFEKVWEEVERIVTGLCSKLFSLLENMELSTDVHERYIGYLTDLDSPVDPVWHFINANHTWINKMLQSSFDSFAKSMESCVKIYAESCSEQLSVQSLTSLDDLSVDKQSLIIRQNALQLHKFRKALLSPNFKEFETIFGKDSETKAWKAILALCSQHCDIVGSYLPDFWNICRFFIDGKFLKATQYNSRSKSKHVDAVQAEKCVQMFLSILETFSRNILHSIDFILASSLENWNPKLRLGDEKLTEDQKQVLKSFFQHLRESSVHAFHYLPKTIIAVNDCFVALSKSLKPVSSAIVDTSNVMDLINLQSTLEMLKKSLSNFLCSAWIMEASTLYSQEDGKSRNDRLSLDRTEKRGSTIVKLVNKLQKLALRSLFQVVTMIEFPSDPGEGEKDLFAKKFVIPAPYMLEIRNAFCDSIYAFFDGQYFLANHPTAWDEWVNIHAGKYPDSKRFADVKYLIILENIDVTRHTLLPLWESVFEDLFKSGIGDNIEKISGVATHLDNIVFDAYVKRKRVRLQEIIVRGCLFSGFDWKRSTAPMDLHPIVNESLLYLVEVHAEIKEWLSVEHVETRGEARKMSLLQRIFVTLLLTVIFCFQDAYRNIDSMSPFGGLHAYMDIQAILDIVKSYADFIPNLASIERNILSIICENVGQFLMVTKNLEITDVSRWFDGQKDLMDSIIQSWKMAGEIGHRCLKNGSDQI